VGLGFFFLVVSSLAVVYLARQAFGLAAEFIVYNHILEYLVWQWLLVQALMLMNLQIGGASCRSQR
jgi:hypothetical protein